MMVSGSRRDASTSNISSARSVTANQAAELQEVVKQMREAVASAELLRYSDANARLHALIRAIAGHETAAGIIERPGIQPRRRPPCRTTSAT